MASVQIRFYEELNYFLSPLLRKRRITGEFAPGASVKHFIENLGVPHTEVDLILVNGSSVGFDYLLRDGDDISVYPVFESFDISALSKVRPTPLRQSRFILDVHLGTLAVQLRMLGFDTLYQNDLDDDVLALISQNEHRILLTRDRGLLKRKAVTHGYFIRSRIMKEQLTEIIARFDLSASVNPFTRCLKCNTLLTPISKPEAGGRVPAFVFAHYEQFKKCGACDKIYWKGTHWKHMRERLPGIMRKGSGV